MRVADRFIDDNYEEQLSIKARPRADNWPDKIEYHGIEFPTFKELEEYKAEHKDIEHETIRIIEEPCEVRDYVVVALSWSGSYIYLGKSIKYTYTEAEAKLFSKSDAQKAAVFASRNGTLKWSAHRIRTGENKNG